MALEDLLAESRELALAHSKMYAMVEVEVGMECSGGAEEDHLNSLPLGERSTFERLKKSFLEGVS